jgi:hypothetical protein
MSLYVGTVGSDGVPAGCRAVAAFSEDGLKTVTVYVPVATSREVLMNVAATKRLALVGSHPPTHSAMQIKGTTTAVRLAADDEAPRVRRHLDSFADVLHLIGVPRHITRRLNYWPAFAIELKVDEIFEQTPGPKAGTPIR